VSTFDATGSQERLIGSSSRTLGARLRFSLIACVLAFVLIELGCASVERIFSPEGRQLPQPLPGPSIALQERLLADRVDRGLEIAMREVGVDQWELPAGTGLQGQVPFRVNTIGLRGAELVPAAPDETRILTVGDSSVFGYGVPERGVFSSVLAESLSNEWERQVTAFNGGVPGLTAPAALHSLRERVRAVGPDYLVVGLIWSDVYGAGADTTTQQVRGLGRRFATYRLMRRAMAAWLGSQQVGFINSRDDVGTLVNGVPTRTALEDYRQSLHRIVEIAASAEVQPVFLVLPAPMDFDDYPVPATVSAFREAMCSVASDADALCVDAVACFRDAGAGASWFLDQVHPAIVGHALLAECLVPAFPNTIGGHVAP